MSDLIRNFAAKILLIDDEELNIQLLRTLLAKEGYTDIVSTTDPLQAAVLYTVHQPDLVLLDLNMPDMDGFEVLETLSRLEQNSYLPVMVLSAQADNDSRLRALKLGAKDFLNKPFNRLEVLTRIQNMLEVRLLHKKLRKQNEELEHVVAERTRALRESQLEIVQRLGLASEFRDNETGQHIIRMSYYSFILAQQFGLPEKECELILNSSPMHDIGKLGIPDSILLKPGKLTNEEFRIMQNHTTIGGNLLESARSEVTEAARIIALTHHEKWDGSGYPANLKGEDIPLYGRIVAVADVFDALTSVRPYKPAWSVDKAIAEIMRCSGTQFDPKLVASFSKAVPKLLEVKSQYADDSNEELGLVQEN